MRLAFLDCPGNRLQRLCLKGGRRLAGQSCGVSQNPSEAGLDACSVDHASSLIGRDVTQPTRLLGLPASQPLPYFTPTREEPLFRDRTLVASTVSGLTQVRMVEVSRRGAVTQSQGRKRRNWHIELATQASMQLLILPHRWAVIGQAAVASISLPLAAMLTVFRFVAMFVHQASIGWQLRSCLYGLQITKP